MSEVSINSANDEKVTDILDGSKDPQIAQRAI